MAKKKEEAVNVEVTEEATSTPRYIVNRPFTDKFDLSKHYAVGDEFNTEDIERIEDLIARGLIVKN